MSSCLFIRLSLSPPVQSVLCLQLVRSSQFSVSGNSHFHRQKPLLGKGFFPYCSHSFNGVGWDVIDELFTKGADHSLTAFRLCCQPGLLQCPLQDVSLMTLLPCVGFLARLQGNRECGERVAWGDVLRMKFGIHLGFLSLGITKTCLRALSSI